MVVRKPTYKKWWLDFQGTISGYPKLAAGQTPASHGIGTAQGLEAVRRGEGSGEVMEFQYGQGVYKVIGIQSPSENGN